MVSKRIKMVAEDALLTIAEAAALLGVSVSTLRNWDKHGKFTPKRHPINGYRLYKHKELDALKRRIMESI